MKRSKQQISRLMLLVVRRIGEIWAWVVILGWLESRATVQRWLLRIFVKTKIKDRSLSKAGNWHELGSGVVRRQRVGFLRLSGTHASPQDSLRTPSIQNHRTVKTYWPDVSHSEVRQNGILAKLMRYVLTDHEWIWPAVTRLRWFLTNLVCIHDHLFTNQASSITPSVWSEGQHILAWERIGRESE